MTLNNFPVIILHPNTLTTLIDKRQDFLTKEFSNYFSLFPLYGIFSNQNFSKDLKVKFSNLLSCEVFSFFSYQGILFFQGSLQTQKQKIVFIIPFAIEKKTDSKNLLSVFNNSFKCLKNLSKQNLIPLENKISFKSFQIADCHISEYEYNLFENFWIKTIS